MRVGWLGLGAMGAPMATRLARCGHSVHAYDIAPDRAAQITSQQPVPVHAVGQYPPLGCGHARSCSPRQRPGRCGWP
jgi:6-phosphogluconate dehydrogenase (decarboxylating)